MNYKKIHELQIILYYGYFISENEQNIYYNLVFELGLGNFYLFSNNKEY